MEENKIASLPTLNLLLEVENIEFRGVKLLWDKWKN